MNQIISEELRSDETLLWEGQPDQSLIFTKMDIFFVPFSLMWGGFAIFWELAASGIVSSQQQQIGPAGFIFPLFGIPFVCVGLYIIFGRFIVKKKRKAKTWYAITNKRIIIASNFMGHKVETVEIKNLNTVSKTTHTDGRGSIIFGNTPLFAGMYANTGMDFFAGFYGPAAPAFYDIQNVADVHKLIQNQRQAAS